MRHWREVAGKSQREAAAHIGVSHTTWRAIENGTRPAHADTITKLADLLGKPIDEIVAMEGLRKYHHSESDRVRADRLEAMLAKRPRLVVALERLSRLQDPHLDLLLSLAEQLDQLQKPPE